MCFHCNLCFKKNNDFFFFLCEGQVSDSLWVFYQKKQKKRKEKEACWREQRQSREHLWLTKVEQSGRRVLEWSREEPTGHGWSGSSVLPHLALVWRAGWPGLATQHQNFFWVHSFGPCTLLHSHSFVPVLTSEEDRLISCCCHWQLLIAFRPPAKQQFHIHPPAGCEARVDILVKNLVLMLLLRVELDCCVFTAAAQQEHMFVWLQ